MAAAYISSLLNWYGSPLGDYLQGGKGNEHIILAHGSGVGMRHEFMQRQADALINEGFKVSLFDYAYMQTIHTSGRRRPPPRIPTLIEEHRQWIALLAQEQPIWLIGKSMGGRIASMLAQESLAAEIKGWCALGYPFHSQKKPQQLRVTHLLTNRMPGLIIQGTRDALGTQATVTNLALYSAISCQWVPHMDHCYNPYKQSKMTQHQAIEQSAKWFRHWIQ